MLTSNDEMLTPREFQRGMKTELERLEAGEVDKLVLMRGTTMTAVILTVEEYERLTGESAEE